MGWLNFTRRFSWILQICDMLESFYDGCDFPIVYDLNSDQYRLNSNTDNMTRSTELYHPIY